MTARLKNRLWLILAAAGIVFIIVGVMRGEAQIVFTKAVNICLECIGIG
ncbi:CD1871A family CXXC motif-containing protein [Christensenella intestinihominis]|nr:CD1871A family CXXC motif-containing protein [Christensenella intestinihominis]